MAHGGIAAVTWLFLSPVAVLVARTWRYKWRGPVDTTNFPKWRPRHQYIQYLTLVLTFVAVSLAVAIINSKDALHFVGLHQSLGILILFLLTMQVTLGWVIHELKDLSRYRIQAVCLHVRLNICLIAAKAKQITHFYWTALNRSWILSMLSWLCIAQK